MPAAQLLVFLPHNKKRNRFYSIPRFITIHYFFTKDAFAFFGEAIISAPSVTDNNPILSVAANTLLGQDCHPGRTNALRP